MATQIFSIDWNDIPASKPVLTKAEIIDYCRHFNQETDELHAFLKRFDFDAWVCMEIGIDYIYGRGNDKQGEVGNDAVEFLSIAATTFFSEKNELALQNYLGFDKKKFAYVEEVFNSFEDCPLWMIKVKDKSRFYANGLFFMPAVFWEDATMTEESYGYSKYTVDDRSWYHDSFGKNNRRNQYWKQRVGSWSPNFLSKQLVADYTNNYLYFDPFLDRVLLHDPNAGQITSFATNDPSDKNTVAIDRFESMNITETEYRFYMPDGLRVTDKDFNELLVRKDKTMNEYQDDFWEVVIDKKGVLVRRKNDGAEKQFKFGEMKMQSSIYSNSPNSLKISSSSKHSLIFAGGKTTIVDRDFNLSFLNPESELKKELPVFLDFFGTDFLFSLPGDRQLFVCKEVVFEIGADDKPVPLNNKLFDITGEAVFHAAIEDKELSGIWLIAGMNRLVFVDLNFENGYVFNFDQQNDPLTYGMSELFFDKDKNLWYALFGEKLYKIDRSELKEKLKTAVPFAQKQQAASTPAATSAETGSDALRLTYQDEKSDKFWEVQQEDTDLHITYGKTGTAGQSMTKSFGSAAEATKEKDKLVKQKRGKGYQ